jgi:hypothetical protein
MARMGWVSVGLQQRLTGVGSLRRKRAVQKNVLRPISIPVQYFCELIGSRRPIQSFQSSLTDPTNQNNPAQPEKNG